MVITKETVGADRKIKKNDIATSNAKNATNVKKKRRISQQKNKVTGMLDDDHE